MRCRPYQRVTEGHQARFIMFIQDMSNMQRRSAYRDAIHRTSVDGVEVVGEQTDQIQIPW
ncbi:MAG: hypothetical protein R3C02_16810 [Planctomycetaceae bacterium]